MERSSGRRIAAVVGSVIAVVALLLSIGLGTSLFHQSPRASGGADSAASPAVGYTWTLTTIDHDGRTTPIPASIRGSLALSPDGHVLANDGVNAISGLYTATERSLQFGQAMSTAVGYAGGDPAMLLTMEAMRGVFASGADDAATSRVDARVTGDTLVVTAGAYSLTFTRHGTAENPAPPRPTTGTSTSGPAGSSSSRNPAGSSSSAPAGAAVSSR